MTDKMQVNLRQVAMEILYEVQKNNGLLHVVLSDALKKYQYLDKNERPFISRLVQGTEERKIELDYIIDSFSKTPVKKQKDVIRIILEMSVYQLKYMDSVPASAVCNEAVKLAVKKNFGTLRGFVNGVLRNIARNIDNIEYPDKSTNTDKYLSVKYSVPEELAGYFLKKFGDNETEEMFEAFNKDKSTYIRCNTKKTDIAGLTAALEAEGVTVTNEGIDKRIDYALKISGYDYLGGLKSFRDGLFFVQDISSMLASQGGFIKRDAYVIDVCAAPGGKSINAALMADIGHVSSRDISGRKVSLIKENAERLGIDNITYKVWDAVKKDEESVEKADVLICDLPCSGLGIIGRKPDIKYNVTYEKIKELALLQRKILSTVWEYVKKDGILIYSTCTVTPEENVENTEWLVNNYPFELIGKPEQIMPQDGTGDGFYIARLKRTE